MSQSETKIKGEFSLCFENGYDVYQISDILDFPATECKNQNEVKRNPITGKQNPAYWEFSTGYMETYDIKEVILIFMDKLQPLMSKITKILDSNNGEAIFDFVVVIENDTFPALYFEREFLKMVEDLKATIQFDMYNCSERLTDVENTNSPFCL